MDVILIVLIVLLLVSAVGSVPRWPYSSAWGWYPSSFIGIVLIVLLIYLLMGRGRLHP